MTTLNRVLMKAYEKQASLSAHPEQPQDAPPAVFRGWAATCRQPMNQTLPTEVKSSDLTARETDNNHSGSSYEKAKETGSFHPSSELCSAGTATTEAIHSAQQASPCIIETEQVTIPIDRCGGTDWRIDRPHSISRETQVPTAATAVPAPHAAPSAEFLPFNDSAIADHTATHWKWPTITDRLLNCSATPALRDLADRLIELATGNELRCIAFSGPGRRAGRTALIVGLARILAEENSKRIAVVDSQFDDPGVSRMLSLPAGIGLGHALCDEQLDPKCCVTRLSDRFCVAPLFENLPSEAINGQQISRLQSILQSLRRESDLVLIDAGSWEKSARPRVLECRAIDGFVSVARAHNAQAAQESARDLTPFGIAWLGLIETFASVSDS